MKFACSYFGFLWGILFVPTVQKHACSGHKLPLIIDGWMTRQIFAHMRCPDWFLEAAKLTPNFALHFSKNTYGNKCKYRLSCDTCSSLTPTQCTCTHTYAHAHMSS